MRLGAGVQRRRRARQERRRDVRAVGRAGVLHLVALLVGGEAQHEQPAPGRGGRSTPGRSEPNPRYGDTVRASPASGEPSRRNASA